MAKRSLRAIAKEALKREGVIGLTSYAVRTDRKDRLQLNDICYARARIGNYIDNHSSVIKESIFLVDNAKNYLSSYAYKRKLSKWLDYILNRSLFKNCFKTHSVSVAKRYGVEMDVEQDHSQVVAAMIAAREAWEFPKLLDNWLMLTKAGVSENVAYVFARMFVPHKKGYVKISFGGHQTISWYIREHDANLLLHHGMGKFGGKHKTGKQYAIYEVMNCANMTDKFETLQHQLFLKGKEYDAGWGCKDFFHTKASLIEAIKGYEKKWGLS